MKILMLGVGSAGSWTIRGHQLGAALGARVTTTPTPGDWAWADVIVLVKRAIVTFGVQAKATGKPVVWDALDFWAQPAQNGMSLAEGIAQARTLAENAGVTLIIGATMRMAEDLGGLYLPHHAWAGLTPAPARAKVSVVAYQGNPQYLGLWAPRLLKACRARGWRFVVNPEDLHEADILVAFRDGIHDGEICRLWKSGVKFANAIAAGRPIISQPCAARYEMQPPGCVVDGVELDSAVDYCAERERREAVVEAARLHAQMYQTETVAARYRRIIEGVACPA